MLIRPLALVLLPVLATGCATREYVAWPDPARGWGVSTSGSSTSADAELHSPRVAVYESAEDAPPQAERLSVTIELFYEELEPYGTWSEHESLGRVFVPYDGNYRPYQNGHWVESEEGLLWVSHDAIGWAVTHYGEWAVLDDGRWAWVPGVEWAPAWVEWRRSEEEQVIGWSPVIAYGAPAIEARWVFVSVAQLFVETVSQVVLAATSRLAAYQSCVTQTGANWGRRGPPGRWLRRSGLRGQRVSARRFRRGRRGRRGEVAVAGSRNRRGGARVAVHGRSRGDRRVRVRGPRDGRVRHRNPGARTRRVRTHVRSEAPTIADRPSLDSRIRTWEGRRTISADRHRPRARPRATIRLPHLTPPSAARAPRVNVAPRPLPSRPLPAPPPTRAARRIYSEAPVARPAPRILPPSPPGRGRVMPAPSIPQTPHAGPRYQAPAPRTTPTPRVTSRRPPRTSPSGHRPSTRRTVRTPSQVRDAPSERQPLPARAIRGR